MTPMRCLYLDMNAFFASVEQQVNPRLRGRPVAITALQTGPHNNWAGAVVAASYEAKSQGVKTIMRVTEARQICPDIVFLQARHKLYARANQAIARAIDRIAEVERVRSIDELQIGLGGPTAKLPAAMDLARDIKRVIREDVGSVMRCSIGIGPNQLLAKIAGKLEKPDGLQWLAPENMPQAIAHLKPDDLPGISRRMQERLAKAHVWGIQELYALDPRHARKIWRSVEGERFVRALQGENIPLIETSRGGYGQSKVLAPEYRPAPQAHRVGRWLTERAVARMRRDGYCAGRISIHASLWKRQGHHWQQTLTPTQDTRAFLAIYDNLTARFAAGRDYTTSISVNLTNLVLLKDRSGELFLPLEPGKANRSEQLSTTIDHINRRYGKTIIKHGIQQEHLGFFDRG
ncbi:DNA polymerase Y family protein [Phaeobacter inhibens]|uniref:DNA-directed DNA polymerase n=1 Tax=Phaeobacter inhibens TaxID=221822 RepID=A0A2I7K9M6_9RHOB|nr:UMUC-like DNA-repair protein [Phaeobacter inhibens]AUQ99314.1 Nucleotidyltransferase/DNA polymerase involved in DNA repair [Phaeobacter inhibens]